MQEDVYRMCVYSMLFCRIDLSSIMFWFFREIVINFVWELGVIVVDLKFCFLEVEGVFWFSLCFKKFIFFW